MNEPDFQVSDEGSVLALQPMNDRSRGFASESLGLEGWQWMGNRFVLDHRPAQDLIEQLESEGFTFSFA